MHPIRFSDIVSIAKVKPLQMAADGAIELFITDSRQVLFPQQTAFFAISSPQVNANHFIPALYEKGVRNFITDKNFTSQLKMQEKNRHIFL